MSDTRDWWPEHYDLPAFRVKRQVYGLTDGGDWVRGSSVITLPHTALRYPSTEPELQPLGTLGTDDALLFTRPFDYHTVEIMWDWPATHQHSQNHKDWLELALVRSTFGYPSTPQDGQTVFRALRTDFQTPGVENVILPPPIVYDQPLPSGHWYYYTLFLRMNPLDWVAAMWDGTALPRDFHHRDRLWEGIPPYYQWVDDNYRVGAGYLRQFLTVFGFVLDNTREFVEGYLDLYSVDKTPVPLLKGLGENFGLPYESGIGDIRYRGLVANIPDAQYTRGTAVGLQQVVEAVSKYEVDVTSGQTKMVFPDDSDFHLSTGNWGGLHPDAVASVTTQEPSLTSLTWDNIFIARLDTTAPPGTGTGVVAGTVNWNCLASGFTTASAVWHVSGRNLITPRGTTYPTINGVEMAFWNDASGPTRDQNMPARVAAMSAAAGKGINSIRMLYYRGDAADSPPTGTAQPATATFIHDSIMSAVNAGVPVDVGLSGGKVPAAYNVSDVKAVLLGLQQHIVGLHVLGESSATTGAAWRDEAINAITQVRSYGYTCPFTVMSNYGGRNLKTILDYGAAVLAADPLHNTWFGWQGYWGGDLDANASTDYYQNISGGISYRQAVAAAAAASFRIQNGNCSETDFVVSLPLQRQALCVASGVGTLWWSWDITAAIAWGGSPGPPYGGGTWNNSTATPGENLVKQNPGGMANATRAPWL